MARITEIASIALTFSYVLGSPAATTLRPIVIEAPFVAWHHHVNTAAIVAGVTVRDSGMVIGDTLKRTILSGTFLGRVRA